MNSAPAETERIREALLQAAEADFLQAVGADENPIAFSLSYQRWEAKFLRNPRALAKRLARPLWQRAARAAACLLLAAALSFGGLMLASPQARATVTRWFTTWFDTHVSYNFTGPVPDDQLGLWEPAYLPRGYHQSDYIDLTNIICIFYSNGDPELDIEFSYQLMEEGSGYSLDNEWHNISDISVQGLPGQLFTSTKENGQNMLVWFDEITEHAFLLTSRVPCEILLQIAESVEPIS